MVGKKTIFFGKGRVRFSVFCLWEKWSSGKILFYPRRKTLVDDSSVRTKNSI